MTQTGIHKLPEYAVANGSTLVLAILVKTFNPTTEVMEPVDISGWTATAVVEDSDGTDIIANGSFTHGLYNYGVYVGEAPVSVASANQDRVLAIKITLTDDLSPSTTLYYRGKITINSY